MAEYNTITGKRLKPQGKLNYKIVLQGILQGKKKIHIAPEAGSLATSDSAKAKAIEQVEKTSKFKKMAENIIQELDKEIKRLIEAMSKSDLNGVEYKDMASSIDKLIKNKELLSGRSTENIGINMEEVRAFLDKS